MRPVIAVTIVIGIIIIIIFFVLAVLFSLHINEICEWVNKSIDDLLYNRIRRRRIRRQRRNAIYVYPQPPQPISEIEMTQFRAENIGIIFQQFYLMPHLTSLENVSLPLEMFGYKESKERALEAIEQVGLIDRVKHFPHQLSGGESQRVAIARAIVIRPSILLADEPTGNLDNATGVQVADLIFNLVKTTGMTMLMVTHNKDLANRCSRQMILNNGTFE